ncbi:unnamed protein product, partial [Symbiodinium pilosum]
DFMVTAGDFLTYEEGGPNMQEIATYVSDFAKHDEAMQLRMHYSYGLIFDYENTFDTSTNETFSNRTKGSK